MRRQPDPFASRSVRALDERRRSGGSVRKPMPSAVPSLIRIPLWCGGLATNAASAVMYLAGGAFLPAIIAAVLLVIVAFALRASLRNRRGLIAKRKAIRERNFWAVMEHQIVTELPTPSQPLAELEAQLAGGVREQLAEVVEESRGTPDPNSKRSQKRRERRERAQQRRENELAMAKVKRDIVVSQCVPPNYMGKSVIEPQTQAEIAANIERKVHEALMLMEANPPILLDTGCSSGCSSPRCLDVRHY